MLELIQSIIPLVFLTGFVSLGYHFLGRGLSPKRIKGKNETRLQNDLIASPKSHRRALTDRELGIDDIRSKSSPIPSDRQNGMTEQTIRQQTRNSPNGTAGIIKGWLRDR